MYETPKEADSESYEYDSPLTAFMYSCNQFCHAGSTHIGLTFSLGGVPGIQTHPLTPSFKIVPSEPIMVAFPLTFSGAADIAISMISSAV